MKYYNENGELHLIFCILLRYLLISQTKIECHIDDLRVFPFFKDIDLLLIVASGPIQKYQIIDFFISYILITISPPTFFPRFSPSHHHSKSMPSFSL